MRKFGKKQVEEETEIDITPMLDVVFIMLIFFIVTATFVREAGTDVTKPTAKTARAKPSANILVAIDAQDNIWIDGDKSDPREIKADIKNLRAENPKGSVIIQADKDSTHERLLEVMEAANLAGVDEIAISAGEDN